MNINSYKSTRKPDILKMSKRLVHALGKRKIRNDQKAWIYMPPNY